MNDPITIAGTDIDPERFPQIYWFAQQNPEMVEEKLVELLGTFDVETALEALEMECNKLAEQDGS